MTIETEKHIDTLDLFQRRMELLAGARLRDSDTIDSAIKMQDKIRIKVGKWNGSKEIKKWRQIRKRRV